LSGSIKSTIARRMNLKVCCRKEGKQGKWLKGRQEVGGPPGEEGSKENL